MTRSVGRPIGGSNPLFVFSWAYLIVAIALIPACLAQNMPDTSLTETITELKAKAADRPVRVIVQLKTAPADQAYTVENAKAALARSMHEVGVLQVDSIEGQPLMVMELTAEQLDHLAASDLVKAIQEDKPEGLY